MDAGSEQPDGNLFIFLPLLYIVPSIVMYGAVNYVMLARASRAHFASSFYRLFACGSFLWVTHNVTYFIFIRSLFAPALVNMLLWIKDVAIVRHGIPFLCYYSVYGQFICNTAMSLNRLTVFTLNTGYATFWRRALRPVICVIMVPPALLCWQFLFGTVAVEAYKDMPDTLNWDTKNEVSWWRTSRVSLFVILMTAVPSFLMNMYVIVQMALQVRFGSLRTRKHVAREDAMLFLLTLILFMFQLAEAAIQVIFLFPVPGAVGVAVFRYQVFLVDVSTLAPVWSLLFTSREVRSALKDTFSLVRLRLPDEFVLVFVPGSTSTSTSLQI